MKAHQQYHSRAPLETKSDEPGLSEVKDVIKQVMTGFEEFKATNDARLKEIEKKGAADPITAEKLAKIEGDLVKFEGMNQKLTLAEKTAKAVEDAQKQLDEIVSAMKRTNGGGLESKAGRVNDWANAVVAAHTKGIVNLSVAEQKALTDVRDEYKALAISPDTAGGYLAPVEYVREIIKGVTEISPARALARVRTTAAKSIQIPKRTGQFAARRAGEREGRSETDGLTYGLMEINAPEMYAIVLITNQMLEDGAFNMESEISMEAMEQFAVREGQEFVSGDGVNEMQGFLSAAGVISVNSGTATTIADADGQANGLLSMKYSLKTAYTRNANFLLNRTTLGSVRRLKDANKNYLWMPGIAAGRPNTIDGDPYVEVPDMPSEGAGLKPIAYGDFQRGYTMVDRIAMEMLRDPFTGADDGVVKFRLRRRVGGQVVLGEAIKTLTCATL